MTTTKRYPKDPYRLDERDFIDGDSNGVCIAIISETCLNCGTELGHVEDGFIDFWRDADLNQPNQDDAWCDACVDDPEEFA